MEKTEPQFEITLNDLEPLKEKYSKAVKNKQEKLTYKKKIFLTDYAKYLIEYLENNGKHRE